GGERSPARRRLGDVRVLAGDLERVPNRGRLLRLDEPKVRSTRRLVFARRILGACGKASFATQVFEASLVTPLTALDGARLEDLFAVSTHVGRAFERYEPE